jgi:tyrosinase
MQPASAVVQLPAGLADQARTAGATLVANLTLNLAHGAGRAFMVVMGGPDDVSQIDADSPFHVATIFMFGNHMHGGAMSYALPIGAKLGQSQGADGTVQLRVVPMQPMEGGHEGHDAGHATAVELLSANVEMY